MRFRHALVAGVVLAALVAPAALAAPSLTRAERRAVNKTVDGFVLHAVRHKNPAAAYDLVSPDFRGGETRREWARDDPAYPYPARGRTFPWHLQYVEPDEIGGTLLLQPRKGAKVGPIIFDLRLTKHGGRWLVDSLIPAATLAPLGGAAKVRSVRDFSPQPAGEGGSSPATGPGRINSVYLVVPFAVLGVLLAGLAGWGLVARRRDRRILREYSSARPLTMRADDARARSTYRP